MDLTVNEYTCMFLAMVFSEHVAVRIPQNKGNKKL